MENELNKSRVETTTRMKRFRSTADPDATLDHEDKKLKHEERIKKKKVAMMFAYSGVGYFGLQRNQGMKTIEGELMDALFKAGLITEDNYNTPQSLQFQRAARTDKGVSALKQIVSLKLPEAAKKEDINAHLPEQIRILSIKRVTKGFNSKNNCNARTYSYTCPSYAFATPEETGEEFRLTPDRLGYIQALLKQYEGTHNFHNFTSKRKPLDPSNSRFIMSFVVEQPFLRNGLEFLTLKVKGQSFMLHQIRKMVGVAMAIARNHVGQDIIDKAYGLEQYDLPMAPGLGLLLEQVHYDIYDLRFGEDGVHQSLHFREEDAEVEKFRQAFILPYIGRVEASEKPMLDWLRLLSEHSFDTREAKAALAEANGETPEANGDSEEEEEEEEDDGKRNGSNGKRKVRLEKQVRETKVESRDEKHNEKGAGLVESTTPGTTRDSVDEDLATTPSNVSNDKETPAVTVEAQKLVREVESVTESIVDSVDRIVTEKSQQESKG